MEARSEPSCVHRLEFDVDWPPGHVAAYLVDGTEPILVDAALPDHDREFVDALAGHGYDPGDVEHVLITHPHVDHIGQIPNVLEEGNPTVYAPVGVRERFAQDADGLESRVRRNCIEAGFPDEQREEAVEMAVTSLERNAELLPLTEVDIWLEPDDPTDIGDLVVDPVHVPGHQADHLSYRASIEDESVLMAGDMGIRTFRPVVLHDGLDDGHREAFDAFHTALDRLEAVHVDRVFPGHGPIHDELAAAVERDRESLDDRLERVRGLVADGYATVPGIAAALAGERDVRYLVPEAMSALAHLDDSEEIDSHVDDGIRYYEA